MASYFRNIPNFEYVNRLPESHSSSEYIEVKNLFKNFLGGKELAPWELEDRIILLCVQYLSTCGELSIL